LSVHVIILAAGQGKRMMSDLPKVAHTAAGRTLIGWVLESVRSLDPVSTVVVVGHGADHVTKVLPASAIVAIQETQLGTGHATQVGLDAVPSFDPTDPVVVLYGDMPLLTEGLISDLAEMASEASAVMVTADLDDPTGYGRVLRDADGGVAAVIEDRDCTVEQRLIKEINAGVYAFQAGALEESLKEVSNDNVQGEYYLTDVVGILVEKGDRLQSVKASAQEVMGINSQDQLSEARKALQQRTNQRLMESGVEILDPDHTYIDETVRVEPGARIYPGVHLEGSTSVGADTQIGPDTFLVDSTIGRGARVWYSVLRSAEVGDDCEVGPYASLRPGTVLLKGAKAGTFVETKNTTLAEGAKAPHLSYLGDATVGARSNIGAGTVTCNYDGYHKHTTEIGEEVFIGSATMLVAPVKIGDNAVTGAGSVISEDVSEGALAVERSEQTEIPGYAERREAQEAATESED
jgi:bifunctional UDP-N-acetylglucosamine pyrophosphorylase/glucosamine-1-phosphate N-acetyltransferase